MKNKYIPRLFTKSHLKISTQLYVVLALMFFAGTVHAQTPYKATGDSHFKISVGTKHLVTDMGINNLYAEGDFVLKNGRLDDVKSLKLSMPMGNGTADDSAADNDIKFKLTHVMVLPILQKVFVVGFLNMKGTSHRIDMEFALKHNQNETISLTGTKKLKLSDYQVHGDRPSVYLASYGNNDDVVLNMNFVFAKVDEPVVEQPLITIIQSKSHTRFAKAATR